MNRSMLGKLALFAAMMFGFGWAMIPLYNAICEATGLRVLTQSDDKAREVVRNTQVDPSRTITVEFDANSHGPWRFKPEQRSIQAHPGELVTVEYELVNTVDRAVAGQAIPSYAPSISARHFHKVECFCFRQQLLQAGESRRFPVVFMIDHELPAEVTTITLSYTFFDVGGQVGKASRTGDVEGPRSGS
ncbi:MAG: cytochrome c oxidase assembly protein [Lautropia sp.]